MTPRLLTKQTAAAYCGISPVTFDAWIRDGLLPPPITGHRRYDRRAIDLALDKLSNLDSTEDQSQSAYERRRKRKHGQG
ncbi:Helix-turn-helix domain-containing protein [Cohaesibacter sp. ES.047]|uniref:helix-turn-helix transcriptional regulator n=1 Tax=Cohaesibacter sp. ES.047 TaxID=1798205 RepID=UPI000BC093FA|nr:helix-turn-helix domain-containing protein [Cohaesibacter sp. ES.047]SNY94109.1 Helix-turn-helix domain-containing protein [Cohaesibacter sp. ES.047]